MPKRPLKSGYTTGTCAAAAAKGAALLLRDGHATSVEISLPTGVSASFELHGQLVSQQEGCCYVIKEAGDDPDITHGIEVHARIRRAVDSGLRIVAGQGIGQVTKPGLAVAVGEAAINPVPRQMIIAAVAEVFPRETGLELTLSIPDGVQRAEKTLNARLGIIGGLSILGTTGIVKPISHKAWTDTLDVALDVALAAQVPTVVLATGRSSEAAVQKVMSLPEEAYVMMGDHVGYALQACHRKGVKSVCLAAQFAKLLKIACGHKQTHVHHSRLDLARLCGWGKEIDLDAEEYERLELANTARQVFLEIGSDSPLVARVGAEALNACAEELPGAALTIMLVDYQGQVATSFSTTGPV